PSADPARRSFRWTRAGARSPRDARSRRPSPPGPRWHAPAPRPRPGRATGGSTVGASSRLQPATWLLLVGLDDVVGGELAVLQPRQLLDGLVVAGQHRLGLGIGQAGAPDHALGVRRVLGRELRIASQRAHEFKQSGHVLLPVIRPPGRPPPWWTCRDPVFHSPTGARFPVPGSAND